MASTATRATAEAPAASYCVLATEVVLRFLLLASAIAAVAVMVTSKQIRDIFIPFPPFSTELPAAKFNKSPAFIYFVAALSVVGLYSIITTLISLYALCSPPKVMYRFVILDVPLLGIVAAATGVAGAIAYLGLKGNSDVGWRRVCDTYDHFCKHIGASVALSLFASIVLIFLVLLSILSLTKKITK
ncbi:hypothetical protein BUALT_Bualt12G0124300 [Buddleja alternifolia]|uniref:CASP-like protein n=1 Tax=Buddleja alternifolia TaxID=168488 RepID=A0AAV6WRA3_9LAMI|nr:hypothetical protein BUALT_Bualt12G0124300 [Buddleja alternifolia]